MSAGAWSAALAVDVAFGEPPRALHPVVLIGRAIAALERRAPHAGPSARCAGALVALVPATLALAVAAIARPAPLRLGLLKTTFALRALLAASERIELALRAGDLARARAAASEMVSRPVADLDERLVASAAIESLSENLGDSYVAPLFWYAVAGLPGAAFYRAVNTADAMIGYRDARYRDLGFAAARLDDVMSFIPARLTAVALAVAAPVVGASPRLALRTAWRDAGTTVSPNSGWPMAAAAGALGVRLEKRDHHRLGDGPGPGHIDIARARRLAVAAAAVATLVFAIWRGR